MLSKFISAQLAKPSGFFGRMFTAHWLEKNNQLMNELTLKNLALGTNDHLLEIGFGSGYLIDKILRDNLCQRVCGGDFSEDMLILAKHRFRQEIDSGRLDIQFADVVALPYPNAHFSAVCSVNTIYFWPDITAALLECRRVLQSNGRIALCFNDKSDMQKWPGHVHGFTLYEVNEIENLLSTCDFTQIQVHSDRDSKQGVIHCVSAYAAD